MTESGGAGVPFGAAGSGIISWFMGLPGLIVSAVTGYGVLFQNWIGRGYSKLTGIVG